MTKMKMLAIAAAMAALSGGGWLYKRADANEATTYRFATLERGGLQATVSATGTLSAVRTVQVGTQVSGQVSAIYADFNDHVTKGELLARIDPTLQRQAVQDAEAGLERAQAQLDLAKQDYDRNKQLFDAKIVTTAEFETVRANYTVAQTNVKSAGVAVSRARQNLAYTNIYSPIDGIIVDRNVDVGQTVAASLSAPQLFLIANDLSHMQILASVDESDIGAIKPGQDVHFTVQSYANRPFVGHVSQVRLQSKTQDNVVNYTVVVGVDNPTRVLLPGMTATVKFITGSASDVLTVTNAALRFRPTAEMLAAAGVTRTASSSGSRGALWYVDQKGGLHTTRVRVGLTDGQKTEVESDSLQAGTRVIVGSSTGTQSTTTSTNSTTSINPLQPQGPRGAGGGGGGGAPGGRF